MRREFKKYKSISFKQALLIVLALHGFAFLGFTQWSNYKAKLAKEFREAQKAQLLAESSSKQDWNNKHVKPKIVAVAPTPKPVTENKQQLPSIGLIDIITNVKTAITEIFYKNVSRNILEIDTKQQVATIQAQKPKQTTLPSNKLAINNIKPLVVVATPTPLPKVAQQFLATKTEQRKEAPVNKTEPKKQISQKREEATKTVPREPVYTKEVKRTYNTNGTYEDETTEIIVRTLPQANGYHVPVISSTNARVLNEMTLTPVY